MKNQFVFDGVGTFEHLGLLLGPNYEIGDPEVKESYIEIPFRDGSLDFTENKYFNNRIFYKDRNFKAVFIVMGPREEWLGKLDALRALIHGKRVNIKEPDEPDFIYNGRLNVGSLNHDGPIATIQVTGKLRPFKKLTEPKELHFSIAQGYTNLIDNGDFSNDLTGWSAWSSAELTKARKGVYIVSRPENVAGSIGIQNDTSFDLKAGETYTISFKALAFWGNNFNYMYLVGPQGSKLLDHSQLIDNGPTTVPVLGPSDFSHQYSLTFTPAEDLKGYKILIGSEITEPKEHPTGFYFTQLQLEKGSSYSVYKHSMKDDGKDIAESEPFTIIYPARPQVTTDEDITLIFDDKEYYYKKGTSINPVMELVGTDRTLVIKNKISSNVTITYEESRL